MTTPLTTSHDLERFLTAQASCYDAALAELRAGMKRTHWIWYVLPQLRGLGMSRFATDYGIVSLEEARAYLAHPTLGARLRDCVLAIGTHRGTRIDRILGEVDAMKYRSCLTLFRQVDDPPSLFAEALDQFFQGQQDPRTLELLASARRR